MQAIPIWDKLKETTGQFRRLVFFSLKIKWPFPSCHASQHCHLHICFLLCPNQSCLLCQAGLRSAKWTRTVHSAVLSQSRSCWDSWVPWWAHILIPALQQVFLNARRCFDAQKRETVRYLPSAAGERWVDVWVTNTAGTKRAGADVTGRAGKNRNRDGCERLWPCCPYWPIPCLQPTDTRCLHQHLT